MPPRKPVVIKLVLSEFIELCHSDIQHSKQMHILIYSTQIVKDRKRFPGDSMFFSKSGSIVRQLETLETAISYECQIWGKYCRRP